ncbi:Rid family hydrolase [Allosphingosinicella vermicomposti]|uniref:Rid family hydrolase n=1 Tax=Allosphingosinicella vermicomposti TaxID=614671 RepID=UPI000D0FEDF6|nr:Rid family hydrolase [Allosphingosinicella vermicomposti]
MTKTILKALALGTALAGSAGASAQTRTDETALMSNDPDTRQFQDEYGFSDAVIAGDLIFLSGIVAGSPGRDLEKSYDSAYKLIGEILNRAGASYDDIVDINSFHVDVKAEIGALSKVQKKYLKSPYPAWTAIDVDRLLPDNALTEIKIVARKPAAK